MLNGCLRFLKGLATVATIVSHLEYIDDAYLEKERRCLFEMIHQIRKHSRLQELEYQGNNYQRGVAPKTTGSDYLVPWRR